MLVSGKRNELCGRIRAQKDKWRRTRMELVPSRAAVINLAKLCQENLLLFFRKKIAALIR